MLDPKSRRDFIQKIPSKKWREKKSNSKWNIVQRQRPHPFQALACIVTYSAIRPQCNNKLGMECRGQTGSVPLQLRIRFALKSQQSRDPLRPRDQRPNQSDRMWRRKKTKTTKEKTKRSPFALWKLHQKETGTKLLKMCRTGVRSEGLRVTPTG